MFTARAMGDPDAPRPSRGGGERKAGVGRGGRGVGSAAGARVDDDVQSRRVSGTGRRTTRGDTTRSPSKLSVSGEAVERPSTQRVNNAIAESPTRPSPRMTRAAEVLREAKALMRELSPRNFEDVDVRHDDADFSNDSGAMLDVVNTGGRWRSLRAPASSARARLEAETEDSKQFVNRNYDSNRSKIFAAIAAAAPPSRNDFGASKLVERTGALRAASAAAQAAAAAARGWRRPGSDPLFDKTGEVKDQKEKLKIDEEVRKLRARLTKELRDKETVLVNQIQIEEETVAVSKKLEAANLAKEKAKKEIQAAEDAARAAERRCVSAEASVVAERDAAAAVKAQGIARKKQQQAESKAAEAEQAEAHAKRRTVDIKKRSHFHAWRGAVVESERLSVQRGTSGAVKLLIRRARKALRAWGLQAAATRAREEAAAATRAEEMDKKMTQVAVTWRRAKLMGLVTGAWRLAVEEARASETAETAETATSAETAEPTEQEESPSPSPSPKTIESETQTLTPSKINWSEQASAFWKEDFGEAETRREISETNHLDEISDDEEELTFEDEAQDAADATRDATQAARDVIDDPKGAEDIMRLVKKVREAHLELEPRDAPTTTNAQSEPQESPSEPYENPWAHSPPQRMAAPSTPQRRLRVPKHDARSAARAAARADLVERTALAREEAAQRAAAKAAEEGEIERSIAAARTAEVLATRHAVAAKKAAQRRAAVIAAESNALAHAHGERTLLRRVGFLPWRMYVTFVKGAAKEAQIRGVEAPLRRAYRAWRDRARLRLGLRAYAVARLTVVSHEYLLQTVLKTWREASVSERFARASLKRSSFTKWSDLLIKSNQNKLTAHTFHVSVTTQRVWGAWVKLAEPAIVALRTRKRIKQELLDEKLKRHVFSEWRIFARAEISSKRKQSDKNALFVKVGAWLEEMRGDLTLTPSPGSESSSSPASREARRARFYRNGVTPKSASAQKSKSRLSPDEEPRGGLTKTPTPPTSPFSHSKQASSTREWCPGEMPAQVLSMPSPTPKKSPKKSEVKKLPVKRHEQSEINTSSVRRFSLDSDLELFFNQRDETISAPADEKENDDWLKLDVTPPHVMTVLQRERAAISHDADRSEQRALKFASNNTSRISALAQPKQKSPLKKNPLKKEGSAAGTFSAGTRARLERLKTRKQKTSV